MGDYIERQAAIDVLEERLQANGYSNVALVSELNRSIGYLMRLPSADVQPVVSMHWTPIFPFKGGWSDVWRCSACGSQVSLGCCTDVMDYDFCPYCGARMDGEQND